MTEQFFQAAQPPEVELSLAVTREVERQAGQVDRQWKLRLDRAGYEARLAERRYKAVDPDNRVVARTLESEWNEKLRALGEVEREYEEARGREKVKLSSADRHRLLALGKDLRRIWDAPSTTNAERKNLLRMMVRDVTLSPVDVPKRLTRVQILWQTGAVSDFMVPRRTPGEARKPKPEAIALIRELVAKHRSDPEIVAELNGKGLRTGAELSWTVKLLAKARREEGIYRRRVPRGGHQPLQREDGLHSTRSVAQRFGVSEDLVYYWIRRGYLRPVEGGGTGRTMWFALSQKLIKELKSRNRRSLKGGHLQARQKEA
jgi:hypothetical protein